MNISAYANGFPVTTPASASASLGSLSVAQALHERICLLFLRLEGCQEAALSVLEFDLDTGWNLARGDRESLYRRLVDALCAYGEVTGGMVHPVNERLLEISV